MERAYYFHTFCVRNISGFRCGSWQMLPVRKSLHSAKNIRQEIRGGNLLFKVTSDSSYAAAADSQQKCITMSRIQASPKPYSIQLPKSGGRTKKIKGEKGKKKNLGLLLSLSACSSERWRGDTAPCRHWLINNKRWKCSSSSIKQHSGSLIFFFGSCLPGDYPLIQVSFNINEGPSRAHWWVCAQFIHIITETLETQRDGISFLAVCEVVRRTTGHTSIITMSSPWPSWDTTLTTINSSKRLYWALHSFFGVCFFLFCFHSISFFSPPNIDTAFCCELACC